MPREKVKPKCKVCGTSQGHISQKKLCTNCAIDRINQNIQQMQAKQGDIYNKWLRGMDRAIRDAQIKASKNQATLDNFTDEESNLG